MKKLRRDVKKIINFGVFVFGWFMFRVTAKTPSISHKALINLFCLTQGRFNDLLSAKLASVAPSIFQLNSRRGKVFGVLGGLTKSSIEELVSTLNENGYLVFPSALPKNVCNEIMEFALKTKSRVRRMDSTLSPRSSETTFFDQNKLLAVRYDYDTSDLLENIHVQDLFADDTLLAISEAYLRTKPKADVLSMWWHTNFKAQADSEAAQLYHFDMDRIKWLKVFIYLTDVGPEDGPHAFISGSHKENGIPRHFLDRGYVRINDEEVIDYYGNSREVTHTAPRGTIIVEDTRGLHKGTVHRANGASRLILQLQFSNCLFGANYPKPKIKNIVSGKLEDNVYKHPYVYENYIT